MSGNRRWIWKVLGGVGAVLAMSLASAVGTTAGRAVFDSVLGFFIAKSTPTDPEAYVKEMSHYLNETLPKMVDEYTLLKRTYVKGTTIYYSYELPGVSISQLDLQSVASHMQSTALEGYCRGKEMKRVMEVGASVNYTYVDKDGDPIWSVEFAPSDC